MWIHCQYLLDELVATRKAFTLCQVAAVVICLDEVFWVVSVDVKGVEVGADALDGRKVLGQGCASLKDLALGGSFVALNRVHDDVL